MKRRVCQSEMMGVCDGKTTRQSIAVYITAANKESEIIVNTAIVVKESECVVVFITLKNDCVLKHPV
jgi:hypothetical protein